MTYCSFALLGSLSVLLTSTSFASHFDKEDFDFKPFNKVVKKWSKKYKKDHNFNSVRVYNFPQDLEKELGEKKADQLFERFKQDNKSFKGLKISAQEDCIKRGKKLSSTPYTRELWRHNFNDVELKLDHTHTENQKESHDVNLTKEHGRELTGTLKAGYAGASVGVGGKITASKTRGESDTYETEVIDTNASSFICPPNSSIKRTISYTKNIYEVLLEKPLSIEGRVLVLYKKSFLDRSFGYKFYNIVNIFKQNGSSDYKIGKKAIQTSSIKKNPEPETKFNDSSTDAKYNHSNPVDIENFLKEEEELKRLSMEEQSTLSKWKTVFKTVNKDQDLETTLKKIKKKMHLQTKQSAAVTSDFFSQDSSSEDSFLNELRDLDVSKLVYRDGSKSQAD